MVYPNAAVWSSYMKYILPIIVMMFLGCAGHSPGIDSHRVINPGGGLGCVLYTVDPGDELQYTFSSTAWIGLPDEGRRWRWHETKCGPLPLAYTEPFTFVVVADGPEVTILWIGVK
jgi:hypothetical protein